MNVNYSHLYLLKDILNFQWPLGYGQEVFNKHACHLLNYTCIYNVLPICPSVTCVAPLLTWFSLLDLLLLSLLAAITAAFALNTSSSCSFSSMKVYKYSVVKIIKTLIYSVTHLTFYHHLQPSFSGFFLYKPHSQTPLEF